MKLEVKLKKARNPAPPRRVVSSYKTTYNNLIEQRLARSQSAAVYIHKSHFIYLVFSFFVYNLVIHPVAKNTIWCLVRLVVLN